MNNPAHVHLHWSRLTGLCPMVAIGLTPGEALLFGAALLLTLTLTSLGMALLQRWIVAAQRPLVNALLAALTVVLLALLLQAACYRYAQNLTIFLPLLVIVAVLLPGSSADTTFRSDKTLGHELSNAARSGGLFGLILIVFAALRLFVPIEASIALSLIASGLLLAAANRFYPDNTSVSAPPSPTPRIRARVTGPVR
ncbi:MAG TPA: Rnf-Nqr domain containing protein [Spongiibacteraceae bacterium]|nr:Rnf-Nqr domain containing protein [Spongiibacteraceae bacterium]